MSEPIWMTQSEYARHRGVTPGAVASALRTGRISGTVIKGRMMIDSAAADVEWETRTKKDRRPLSGITSPLAGVRSVVESSPAGGETAAPLDAELYDIQAARAKREHHEANLAAMREAKTAGELVEAKAVARAAADIGAAFQQSIEQLIQLAKELAAESDPVKVRTLLEDRLKAALNDAADRLDAMAQGRTAR